MFDLTPGRISWAASDILSLIDARLSGVTCLWWFSWWWLSLHCGGGGCHGGGGGFESLSLFEARASRSYPQTPITFIKCILQSKIDKLTFTPITFTFIMDLPISQNMNMALTLKNMTTLWVLIYSCMYVMISFWHLGHHWNTWEEETDAQRMEDGRKLLFSILVNLSMILTTCYTI